MQTKTTKRTFLIITLALAAASGMLAMTSMPAGPGHGHDSKPAASHTKPAQTPGLAIAHAYIAGMEAADLDALSALFLADGKSSILENASNEGTWEYYSEHHLAPELEVVKAFKFDIAQESEKTFGDTILVEQTGAFTIEINDETLNYRVAVSYLLVHENHQLKIAHLHWSSRPKK
ncbi:MAG: nuclear transport factor 2 family protein [Phycisphaerales bacterium]|nr:nuclear transport factor 2 family protein [Phycisphaerales bacterium]